MSAYLYDEAIVNNLREVIGDSRISIMPVDNAMQIIPRMNDDKFDLPLVTLTRTSWRIHSQDVNHSAKYEGATSRIYNGEPYMHNVQVQKFQFVPMEISYALDVWTRTRAENDEFIRELFWYYMTSPTLQVTVPYDLNFNHNFTLFVEEDIEDNSDISQHSQHGEYFRQTIRLMTDDAKLWKSSSRQPTTVDIMFNVTQPSIKDASNSMERASKDGM